MIEYFNIYRFWYQRSDKFKLFNWWMLNWNQYSSSREAFKDIYTKLYIIFFYEMHVYLQPFYVTKYKIKKSHTQFIHKPKGILKR